MKKFIHAIIIIFIVNVSFCIAQKTFGPLTLVNKIKLDETEFPLADIQDIILGPENHFFIISWQNGNLIEYSPEGQFIAVHATKGRGPGELIMPQSLSVIQGDKLLVANLLGRVSIFNTKGVFLDAFLPTEGLSPITNAGSFSNGKFLVGGRNIYGNTLFLYDSTGQFTGISFYRSIKLLENRNYRGYAGTYFSIGKKDKIYAVQSIDFHVDVFGINGKKLKRFGKPHEGFRKPVAFDEDLDRTPEGELKLEKSFTYYMDVWVDDGKVIVLSRNEVGTLNRDKNRYYIDIYDQKSGEVLVSGLSSEELELELVKNGKFYFLNQHYPSDVQSEYERTIEIYKWKE